MLKGKRIILGISGGISAYKSAELCRRLKKEDAEVIVVMTQAGMKFITPLTMETLSENEVVTELFPQGKKVGARHISLARWADLIIVAPATYNLIGKISSGIADDILTTVISSTKAPVLLAPAMNVNMYENPICQENIEKLKKTGYRFIEPGVGDLACGEVGRGRMAEPEQIKNVILKLLAGKKDLTGRSILVTASRTEEPIDSVRVLTNPSTGKMGYALAEEAFERGAKVTLISGPSNLATAYGITLIRVRTAGDMHKAVKNYYGKSDVLIMCAAVSDFTPQIIYPGKIKKEKAGLDLKLKPTADILKQMGRRKGKKILVGFAIETRDELRNAKLKLKEKNLDLVVVNNPEKEGAGFGVDTNIATVIDKNGKIEKLPLMSKRELAEKIVGRIIKLLKK
ncbi:MAG: bifunctional phosphopantothenoylcysteine decarboxylase/phosphopantothenate--cysteine ligase CoaBC [candidate division Zixibacteria bacterium]|nr:bifunctional phosphopantothenoylcysteine decarboxylase/phosphopantothenate--cysteine ligase CoaBC [candidate division Zixibacteria bacterium]